MFHDSWSQRRKFKRCLGQCIASSNKTFNSQLYHSHIVMWMQQSRICLLDVFLEMPFCVQIFILSFFFLSFCFVLFLFCFDFIFRCHFFSHDRPNRITSTSDLQQIFNCVCFTCIFQINEKLNFAKMSGTTLLHSHDDMELGSCLSYS